MDTLKVINSSVSEIELDYPSRSQIMFPEITSVPQLKNPKDLITSDEIKYLLNLQEELYNNDGNLQRYFEEENGDQLITQIGILSQMRICPFQKVKKYREMISSLDVKNIKNLVSNQYFNPKVMESMMCITDSILYVSPEDITNKSIRNWISDLRQFGETSVSGYALKGSLKGKLKKNNIAEDIFVIKAPRADEFNDELIHEAFVGITSLNYLRDYIPNFTYIYGIFRCSGPVIDPETKEVISWCQNNGHTNYLLMENIAPAVSFKDFVTTATPKEFVSLYLQTLYALRTGYLKCDFTHYDLHWKNVLIRDIPKKDQGQNNTRRETQNDIQDVAIPYETENGLEYWIGSKIATIIDYGRVHIQHEKKNYGFWNYPFYYIYPERSFPLYDAYKLLGFLIYGMNENIENDEDFEAVFAEADKIFKFFNLTEDTLDFIKTNFDKNLFILPLTEKIAEKTLDDLIVHIRSVCDCSSFMSPDPQNYPVLSCQNNSFCLTQNGITEKIGLNQEPSPNSIFEFCDLITRIQRDPSRKNDYLNLITKFDYEEMLSEASEEFNNLADSVQNNLNKLFKGGYVLRGITLDEIINDMNLQIYRSYVFDIVKTLSQIEDLQTISNSYDCVVQLYENPRFDQYSKSFKKQVDDFFEIINPYLNRLSNDISYLNDLYSKYSKLINEIKDDELIWLFNSLPMFNYIENYTIQ